MAYTKTVWQDNVTLVAAAPMNNIENELALLDPLQTSKQNAISYGASPPASPADGDLWCLPVDTTNGVMWMFRYRAASASAYKWEFVGGAPIKSEGGAASNVTGTTYVDFGVSITLPRAGDYQFRWGASMYNATSASQEYLAIVTSANAATDAISVSLQNVAMNNAISVSRDWTGVGLTAGSIAKLQMRVSAGSGTFTQGFLYAIPVRVS